MARVRFYRVDGTWSLVSEAEAARRRKLQEAAARQAGRVVIYDGRGRPSTISEEEAAARDERSRRARRAAKVGQRSLIRERDKGRFGRVTGYSADIIIDDLGAEGAVGALIGRIYDEAKRQLSIARRNGRRGMIEVRLSYGEWARVVPIAVFPPYAVNKAAIDSGVPMLAYGRGRSLAKLGESSPDDWRLRVAESLSLAAPGLINESTDPRGTPASDRAPDVIEDDDVEMTSEVEDIEAPSLPDILKAVTVTSIYQ